MFVSICVFCTFKGTFYDIIYIVTIYNCFFSNNHKDLPQLKVVRSLSVVSLNRYSKQYLFCYV